MDIIYDAEPVVLDENVIEDDEEDAPNPHTTDARPEHQQLPFPSALANTYITALTFEDSVDNRDEGNRGPHSSWPRQ